MKRLTTALATITLVAGLFACETTNKTPATTTSRSTGNQHLQTFSKGIKAINEGDLDSLMKLYADNVTMVRPQGGATSGVQAAAEQWEQMFNTFEDVHMAPQLTLVNGNELVSVVLVSGTGATPPKQMGMPKEMPHEEMMQSDDESEDDMAADSETDSDETTEAEEATEDEAPMHKGMKKDLAKEMHHRMMEKAAGKSFAMYTALHLVFDDAGKIVKEHAYSNPGIMMGQLGLGQAPPAKPAQPWKSRRAYIGTGSGRESVQVDRIGTLDMAFNERNMRLMGTIYDQNVEAHSRFFGQEDVTGKDELLASLKGMFAGSSDMKEEIRAWAAGDWVAAFVRTYGTNDGPIDDMEATGKSYDINTIELYRFHDGKVVETWSFGNGMELLQQLEIIPSMQQPSDVATMHDDEDDGSDEATSDEASEEDSAATEEGGDDESMDEDE